MVQKNFIIVSHVYTTGPGFRLEDYLKDKVKTLVFIGHPFFFAKDRRSFIRFYQNGKLLKQKYFRDWCGPEYTFWLKDILLTFWWVFTLKYSLNYYFALDNLLVNVGFILKILGKVKSIIFYTIDFVPRRFDNQILNKIYHLSESLAVRVSDKIWNLSDRMVEAREKKGINKKYRFKQITVPIGTDLTLKPIAFNKVNRYKIVYFGTIIKKQGIELLIQAMTKLVKKIPQLNLLMIGGGPHLEMIKREVKKLRLEKNIRFTGYIEDFSKAQKLMSNAAVAVAPYVDDEKTYTRYTDPGKVKDYLACGLPVVITKVPKVADEISKQKSGIAINYDQKQLTNALITLLTNEKMLADYRENAIKMAKQYCWNKVFQKALKYTL